MMFLSDDKQTDIIDALNTTCISRYLDDVLNINNVFLTIWLVKFTSSRLQRNQANASDTETSILDLHLSISNRIVSSKI